jgi:hypothetical protein
MLLYSLHKFLNINRVLKRHNPAGTTFISFDFSKNVDFCGRLLGTRDASGKPVINTAPGGIEARVRAEDRCPRG